MQSFAHSTACKKCTHPTKLLLSSLSFYPWMGRRIPKVFLSSLSYLDIDSLDVLLSHFWLHFWKAHFYTMILMIRPYRYWKWTNARFFFVWRTCSNVKIFPRGAKGKRICFWLDFCDIKIYLHFLKKTQKKDKQIAFQIGLLKMYLKQKM